MMRLQDKVAIVTGASSGIGRGIAELFLAEGAKVVMFDLNPHPDADKLGPNALCITGNVANSQEMTGLIDAAVANFGRLDIMVNDAGTASLEQITEMSDETWKSVLDVNLNGFFYGIRAAGAYMKKMNIKGSIINISSILGIVGFRNAGVYCASKGGINQLVRTAALELAPNAIRVNAIAPGFITTNMTKGLQDDPRARAGINAATPLGHFGEPADIAYAAVYLASDESKYVTGTVLYVDGGWTAQ